MNKFLAACLLLSATLRAADLPRDFSYGLHLYEEGDYYRSVTELGRFRYFEPKSPLSEGALRLIASAYLKGEKWGLAEESYAEYLSAYPHSPQAGEAAFFLAESLYEGRKLSQAEAAYQAILAGNSSPAFQFQSRLRLASMQLVRGDWFAAEAQFKDLKAQEKDQGRLSQLERWERLSHEGGIMVPKSLALSVFDSALIPGTGQLYSGYTRDGLATLAIVGGLAGWAIFFKANEQQNSFILFTVASGVFYLGNLQGAYLAAQRANRERPRSKAKEILDEVSTIPAPDPDLGPYIKKDK